MIFDFEPWQLDIDIDLTKQLYRSCKGAKREVPNTGSNSHR